MPCLAYLERSSAALLEHKIDIASGTSRHLLAQFTRDMILTKTPNFEDGA